ncbi:MAG: hypothetical protein A3H39_03280 [candidate division NC10 bacterium RIFCSPLOWO2_02_FULL_66_22]|nr:MAG: hypothetical protein A3H39_03280 [candidate division NC10 bacterium RIFCSPLOWO2_02_FULL_66_22]
MIEVTVLWKNAEVVYWLAPVIISQLNARKNCEPLTSELLHGSDAGDIDSMMIRDSRNGDTMGDE